MNNVDEIFARLKRQVIETIDMSGELEDDKIGTLIDEAIIGLDNSEELNLRAKL